MPSRRHVLVGIGATALIAGAALPVASQPLKELNFGIISTESSSNLKTTWTPFLDDMQKQTGLKINAFFAPDYAGIIEAMRFNKVHVAWFGNASAIQAVDRADGEVFVQTVAHDGSAGYWSLLIAHKDTPLNSLQDVLKAKGQYTFGNGDPNSTSGFLVPSYYVFAQNDVDAKEHFKRVVTANHETNALAVANRQVDLATNNTENMDRLKVTAPDKHAQIKIIWKSPLIPSDPIVWRKDLPAETKKAVKGFMLTYGTKRPNMSDEQIEREAATLAALQWAPFRESSNKQLVPIRELALFRDKTKIQADAKLSAEEKAAKIREIDGKLAALRKAAGV
jgi:phosphonate transport system substrate-binding protein